jgi:hypothetical protein
VTDRLHDHLTFGFRRGCVACAQVEADMARSKRALYGQKAVGEALWERLMDGDPTAIHDYEQWLDVTLTGIPSNREGVAPLQPA